MPKTHWLEYVKDAAVQAIMAAKPCNYIVGTVTSVKPLKVILSESDGLELETDFLHLARNVTDFEATVSILDEYDWHTKDTGGDSNYPSLESHNHSIEVTKQKLMIHNGLKKGEKVLLIRKWGGQDYIIVDRMVN